MRRFILTLAFVLALGTGLSGAESLGLEAAVARALEVNVTYQNALLAVDQAAANRSDLVNWKGIAVSATQKQTSATETQGATTTNFGLSLPLFDQLSASATVDQDQNTTVSLTASPLAHGDTADQSLIAWKKAVLAADQARATLDASVRKAWLAQASAQAQLDLQVRKVALLETAYGDQKALYAKSQVTLAEVRSALKDWTDARTDQSDLERTLVKARATLAGYLQAEAVELTRLSVAEIEALAAGLGPVDAQIQGTSTAVQLEALTVDSARAKANATWTFDPDLTVAASAGLPASGDPTWSASVTVSVALGDWQGTERALADRAVALAEASLRAQQTAARAQESQALLAVQSALATVESRELALVQAQDLLQETQILTKAGEATPLELEEAELGVSEAQNDLFAAWVEVYSARVDLVAARS